MGGGETFPAPHLCIFFTHVHTRAAHTHNVERVYYTLRFTEPYARESVYKITEPYTGDGGDVALC